MKVGSVLGYQAARRVGRSSGYRVCASKTMRLNSPSRQGVAPPDRGRTPLPLGLQAEVCAAGDGRWPGTGPHQHPPEWEWCGSVGRPQRRGGHDFDGRGPLAVPGNLTCLPYNVSGSVAGSARTWRSADWRRIASSVATGTLGRNAGIPCRPKSLTSMPCSSSGTYAPKHCTRQRAGAAGSCGLREPGSTSRRGC